MTLLKSIVAFSLTSLGLPLIFTNDVIDVERERRALVFPSGTVLQFSMGIQTPVSVPNRTFSISVGFQMQYNLPTNAMHWRVKPEIETKREVSYRNLLEIYVPLESFLEDYGFDGNDCLLRIICETAQTPFQHDEMGLFEEIAHALLTPSEDLYPTEEWCSSNRTVWTPHAKREAQYLAAECLGRNFGDCSAAYPSCLQSPLDFISQKRTSEIVFGNNVSKE